MSQLLDDVVDAVVQVFEPVIAFYKAVFDRFVVVLSAVPAWLWLAATGGALLVAAVASLINQRKSS